MLQTLPWLLAGVSIVMLATAGAVLYWRRRRAADQPLPDEWALTARPVFSATERRLYRLLREALPQHVILAKLQLLRFCQPQDPNSRAYWARLLGHGHVSFAICSNSGRVLAVVDLEGERLPSRRSLLIKQAVLGACRVRVLNCTAERLPTVTELQGLVPAPAVAAAGLSAALDANAARRDRRALWQDSGFLQDSFFGSDSRSGPAGRGTEVPPLDEETDSVGGVVVGSTAASLRH